MKGGEGMRSGGGGCKMPRGRAMSSVRISTVDVALKIITHALAL